MGGNVTSAIINSMSNFVISGTISFTILNLIAMVYLAAPFIITILFFKNNEYALYAMFALEGILWMILMYTIMTKIMHFEKLLNGVLSNVTRIASS